ncbi:xanthine dehydrogenase family protein subunit M [Bacillus sp. JJ1521]|uniref:FAD binding domain-containing protein n=1 Tax=Bacillus sp. JJ1521 TaxID=3122957 RepID=UPI0030004303
MLQPFSLIKAKSIDDAVDLKAKLGEDAAFYAGGTELLQVLKEGMLEYENLIGLRSLNELNFVEIDENNKKLRIGALSTHAEIANSPIVKKYQPTFAQLENNIGNIRIRTAGTIGGNLAFAEPRSDPGAYLVAAEADINTISANGTRRIPMSDFWLGPFETALEEGEMITSIEVPFLSERTGSSYQKFSIVEFPMAGVAVILRLDPNLEAITDSKIVVAATNPIPTRLATMEALFVGKSIEVVEKDIDWWVEGITPEMDAVDDNDGSAEYKTHVVASLLRDAVREAFIKGKEGIG